MALLFSTFKHNVREGTQKKKKEKNNCASEVSRKNDYGICYLAVVGVLGISAWLCNEEGFFMSV